MPNLMPQVPFTVVPTASPGSKTAQLIWSFEIAANAVNGPKSLHIILHSTSWDICSYQQREKNQNKDLQFYECVLC